MAEYAASPAPSSTPANVVSLHEKRAAYVVMTNVEVTRTILGTLGASAYGVYAFLDTYCNEQAEAWVSITTIMEGTRLSKSTVQRAIKALIAADWLQQRERTNRFGFVVGFTYTLPHHMTPSDERDISRGVTTGSAPVHERVKCAPEVNTKVNAKVEGDTPPNPPTPKRAPAYSAAFDDWWTAFPRKENKAKAFEAWRKLAPDAALIARIMDGTARYAGCQKVADGYVQLPTTFLNGRRWEDEMVPAGQRPAPPRATHNGRDIGYSTDELIAMVNRGGQS